MTEFQNEHRCSLPVSPFVSNIPGIQNRQSLSEHLQRYNWHYLLTSAWKNEIIGVRIFFSLTTGHAYVALSLTQTHFACIGRIMHTMARVPNATSPEQESATRYLSSGGPTNAPRSCSFCA